MSLDTFTTPPLPPLPPPSRPLNDNTRGGALPAAASPNLVALATVPQNMQNRPSMLIPNRLDADHVPTAFLTAAAGTELPDDVNRSIGWTYCVGTAGDGPYAAAGIVACNRIVAVVASCT